MTRKSPNEPLLNDALLARFVADECTSLECARIAAWMAESPERSRTVELLRIARQQLTGIDVAGTINLDGAWADVQSRMWTAHQSGAGASRTTSDAMRVRGSWKGTWPSSLRTRSVRRGIWAIGATVMLAALMFLTRRGTSDFTDITRTYTTAAGQQATLTLADGTRVILAPHTTLRLVHFGASSRDVVLDRGEAYFAVARAAGTPFIVHSGAAFARVLGTEFLVRRDAIGERVRIAVESGKVRVTNASRLPSAVTLTSGQTGDVADSTVQVNTDELVPGVERASGQLKFHDTPVATILRMVSQWYGYQFRYTDYGLAKRPVSMVISTQSSAEALATIELVLAVNLTVVGDTITLMPHPTRATRIPSRIRTYDIWTPTREAGR